MMKINQMSTRRLKNVTIQVIYILMMVRWKQRSQKLPKVVDVHLSDSSMSNVHFQSSAYSFFNMKNSGKFSHSKKTLVFSKLCKLIIFPGKVVGDFGSEISCVLGHSKTATKTDEGAVDLQSVGPRSGPRTIVV